MSRLKELIQELCPDGVEYVELKELCKIETGKLNANAASESGLYPFFTTAKEVSRINTYRWNTEALLIAGNANVGDVKYYNGKFDAYQRTYVLTSFKHNASAKFLFYAISSGLKKYLEHHTQKAAMTYIVLSTLEKFKIPLPPLEIQKEIVKILDKFTEYDTELQSELHGRLKQYEYYRDKLLTSDLNIPKVKLGDIATQIYRGSGIKRDDVTEHGIPCVRYGEIYTKYNISFDSCISKTSLEKVESPKYFEHGDILFAITGESVDEIAKSVAYLGMERCIAGGDIVVMKHEQNPKYLSYVLSTTEAQMQKSRGKIKSKVVHSSVPALKEIRVPLPPLPIQNRIVEVLDNFDKICSDLKIGLPAEIEKRQQQYEFYRDAILTFVEKGEITGQREREREP